MNLNTIYDTIAMSGRYRYLLSGIFGEDNIQLSDKERLKYEDKWSKAVNGIFKNKSISIRDEDWNPIVKCKDKLIIDEKGIKVYKIVRKYTNGKLAIIKDIRRMSISYMKDKNIIEHSKLNNAIITINANGYNEYTNKPVGSLIIDSKIINISNKIPTIAVDSNGILNIGNIEKMDDKDIINAVGFKPILMIGGVGLLNKNSPYGISSRTIIGQTFDGELVLLVVEKSLKSLSIGAYLYSCIDVLEDFNVYTACNLDGGSSSGMVYRDRLICGRSKYKIPVTINIK